MDPLSISTGIITLLQATTAIISVCYNFRAALKDVPWSLTRIVDELRCLRNILESLEKLAQDLDEPSGLERRPVFASLSDPDNGPLVICLRELRFLHGKLNSSNYAGTAGLKRKSALQAIGWQLKDRDAKECLERIERCKTTLSLALTADEAALLANIRELATSLQVTAQNIDYKITIMADDFQSRNLDEEHRAMMQWLSPVDPYENYEAAISAQHGGSGNWLLESKEFTDWYQAKNSFLWLSGFPGAGKTVLFSRIVAHLEKHRDENCESTATAYFYFDFTRGEFQDVRNMIGSLVAQLCSHFQCPEELTLAFNDRMAPGQRRRPSWEILKQTISRFTEARPITLLVDALDECGSREKALQFLSELGQGENQIRILVTSREEVDIENAFQSFPRLRMEKHSADVDRDIKSYIDRRLQLDSGLKGLALSVKDDIRISLNEKCAGMFRWAQCQLDALSELRTTRAIRANLNQLPKGLNETYANILRRTNKGDVELLRRVLLWVAFAILPLTVHELHEAVAIEADIHHLDEIEESRLSNAQDILSLGGSLLSVSEKGHVKLAHLSVKNYLLSTDVKTDPEVSYFSMSPKEGNEELAINCLTYLSLDSLAVGPSVTLNDWEARRDRHPLLKHVAKAWPYHLRATDVEPKLNGLVSNFFAAKSRETFMSWVQVLNSNWIFKWNDYPRHATPLYYAASFGLSGVVDGLINSGVDLDVPGSRFGGTALHGATLREHIPVMKTLLKAGADPSRADFNLITPLHTAVRIGNVEVIKLLLEFGASKSAADGLGATPCDWALKAGQATSQKLLRGEDCQPLDHLLEKKQDTIYRRAAAFFPSMAVAQGLTIAL